MAAWNHLMLALSFVAAFLFCRSSGLTWCNKNYQQGEPVVPPGGEFSVFTTSSSPSLAFRCLPAIKPYLPEDTSSPAIFLIDSTITYTQLPWASAITLPSTAENMGTLAVTISTGQTTLAQAQVPLNATKFQVPFSLGKLSPQTTPYNVSCSATYSFGGSEESFSSTSNLSFLPTAQSGSVTKMDMRTGALMAKPANGTAGSYETILPIGFYAAYDPYLIGSISVLQTLKEQGFNVIHPIPPYDDQLDSVLDSMEQLGLYFIYDTRLTYMNDSSLIEQVDQIKSRPNLLLWYTADEPDGTSDPLNATAHASDLIYANDGYHPVSLVLNCQNYEFESYAAGADIVLQDVYMVGNNVTFSNEWDTVCTEDFGCCGCDNCQGEFEDISNRMDVFAERFEALGWTGTKAAWTVPQGFGNDTYWPRYPSGNKFVVQSVLAINHGAKGVTSWKDPTSDDIKTSASVLALAMPSMKEYILNPNATFKSFVSNRIDVGLWTVGSETLVLATNLNYGAVQLDLATLPGNVGGATNVTQLLNSGAQKNGSAIAFDSVGSGAFVLSSSSTSSASSAATLRSVSLRTCVVSLTFYLSIYQMYLQILTQ